MNLTLKAMRMAHDKKIVELSKEINLSVGSLEKGTKQVSDEILIIYAQYFKISVEEIKILFLLEQGGISFAELLKLYLEKILDGKQITLNTPKVFTTLRMLEPESRITLSKKTGIPLRDLEKMIDGIQITSYLPKVFTALRMLEPESSITLSEKIGIPLRDVVEYEEGIKMPDENTLEKYANHYNISKKDLYDLALYEMKGYTYKQIVKECLKITEKQE